MEFQKSNIDHVVVSIDQPSPKLNQSPQADSIPQSPQSIAKPLRRLNFSKPRSRFEENKHPVTPRTILQSEEHEPLNTNEDNYSSSSDDEEWFENEEDDQEEEGNKRKQGNKRKRKMNKRALIEWTLFLIIMTCLVCSLTVDSLKHEMKWGLQVWKWCLMVLVMFCGRLVSGWVVGFIVFLIERNFMLREKVLYFVFGLRKSFQNCAWLALVLVAWVIMFPHVDKQSKVLKKVFRALIAVLIGATIWLLKIVFVKVLASSFHVATFFDRMKESVFHHFILDALSGPPMDLEERDHLSQRRLQASKTLPARLRRDKSSQLTKSRSCKQDGSRTIDMEKLKKLSMPGRATAWSVKRLVSYVRSSGLSTMVSSTMDDFGNTESEITSEWEARNSAQRIFKNVAKPGAKYIEEEDLLRFLKTDEIHTIFPLFEGATETGRITKASFRNWVVHAYIERRALAHSLNDTKTAVQQLHKLASAVVIVIITVVSLLVMGLATTKVIFVVTSQLLLVGFMFQNMCKTMFESIIFVFVMHPFDVGDRCVVDGVQMIVEEMNILTTVFLRRSPDMGDSVDFTIDVSTPVDDVTALKKAIQSYIESKPKHWNPKHSVIVKDIVNVDKMKMLLCVQHTMNHQNYGEKSVRRSELVFELKRIFQNLGIKYHLLPQEVNIPQFNKSTGLINRD
ncbi:mechanosensitive ion channel protein 10 isoform X2 [Rosa chinensis]|uniref:mechanosensitive ion channel protein 10 isoform X2 n=1 Tax=Rosa chinensis TaxID=74649 RepID=UPI001AD93D7D|nr:mechanosensitive ion channel protein 10 isoform X2 [Rosa chinensis]